MVVAIGWFGWDSFKRVGRQCNVPGCTEPYVQAAPFRVYDVDTGRVVRESDEYVKRCRKHAR